MEIPRQKATRNDNERVNLELLRVLPFFVPRHLDGFEFAFVRTSGIVVERGQFGHVAVQISEAHSKWIDIRKLFCEYDAEILSIFPTKISRHWTSLVARPPSAVCVRSHRRGRRCHLTPSARVLQKRSFCSIPGSRQPAPQVS